MQLVTALLKCTLKEITDTNKVMDEAFS